MSFVRHHRAFRLHQPAEDLFPLFSPEGEKLWVPGWDYVDIQGAREMQEDAIFLTQSHDHAASTAIWLVKRCQPEIYQVQFYKVEPGEKVGIITIQCQEEGPKLTRVEVTYEYVGLSPRGDTFIEGFGSAEFEQFIASWKRLLRQYFDSLN